MNMKSAAYENGQRDGQKAWDTLIGKASSSKREDLAHLYMRGVIDTVEENMAEAEEDE